MRVIICCWDMTVSMTVLALLAVDHSEVRGPVFTDVCLTAVTRHHMTVSALPHSSHLPTFCRRHMAPKSVGDTIIFSGLWIKIRRAGACYRAVPSEILRLKYILYRSSLSSALIGPHHSCNRRNRKLMSKQHFCNSGGFEWEEKALPFQLRHSGIFWTQITLTPKCAIKKIQTFFFGWLMYPIHCLRRNYGLLSDGGRITL